MSTRTTRAAARASNGHEAADSKQDVTSKPESKTTTPPNTSRKRKASNDASTSATPNIKTEDATPSKRNRNTPAKPTPKPTHKTTTASKAKATPKSTTKKAKLKQPSQADLEGGAKMASAWMKTRDDQFAEAASSASPTKSSPAKNSKTNPYNLTPGTSPYPSFPYPTPQECQHVNDILSKIHGRVSAPKTVPVPSLNSSGCGEVPSVLDALIRTRLSAATNGANSSRAFRGLVEKFGVIKEGVGKGSVDWNKVRIAEQSDVFEAIRSGGLADVKSRDILKILQLVYEENQERKKQLEQEQNDGEKDDQTSFKSQSEISRAKANVVSLDHLHELSSEEAFNKLVQYPGIGPKTASCVLLFCMQRPSFAVDTHVFRLTTWLGWTPSDAELKRMAKETTSGAGAAAVKDEDGDEKVKLEDGEAHPKTPTRSKSTPSKRPRGPPPVTRNSTYSHLDVRIPDELKYPLHYLLIKHGKTCPECSAKKDKSVVEAWGGKVCPLMELKRVAKARARGGRGVKGEDRVDGEEAEEEEEVEEVEEDGEEAGDGDSVKDEVEDNEDDEE